MKNKFPRQYNFKMNGKEVNVKLQLNVIERNT